MLLWKFQKNSRKKSLVAYLLGNLSFSIYPPQLYWRLSLSRVFTWVFRKFLKFLGESLCWNHFCKVTLVESFSNTINFCILHLCQKLYNLHCYVTWGSSRTLEISENLRLGAIASDVLEKRIIAKFQSSWIFIYCNSHFRVLLQSICAGEVSIVMATDK